MRTRLVFLFILALSACAEHNTPVADLSKIVPAAGPRDIRVSTVDLVSDRRDTIPVMIWHPGQDGATSEALPVVLFSTGAFSSPEKYDALLKRWAQAGYAVLAPLHVDSERWTGPKPEKQTEGLAWRRLDMIATIDAIEQIEMEIDQALSISEVAAAGHSFGAMLAQVLGGAQPGPLAGPIPRVVPVSVAAIIAISPPGPIPGYIEQAGWARMDAPQLLTTGSADIVPQMVPEWQLHLAGHYSHSGKSWALVQQGVDHYFGNVIGRTEYPGPPQTEAFDEMVDITTAFLEAHVRRDAAAMATFIKPLPTDGFGLRGQ
ncbi:MAG: alpha/beta hydrolase family protein [Sphingomonadales bacterium]